MTYYSATDWWNTRYKIRTPLTFAPTESIDNTSVSLLSVKLQKDLYEGKIKSDYSDLAVINHKDGDDPYLVPHYVLDEGSYLSIMFPPIEALVYIQAATPSGLNIPSYTGEVLDVNPTWTLSEGTNSDYYLYYSAKGETKSTSALDDLDSDYLALNDYAQEDDNTKWTFARPTVEWNINQSDTAGARAVFEFIGHQADFYFHTGPQYGYFEYQIDGGSKTQVDCYDGIEGVTKLLSVDTQEVDTHKVRFFVVGQSNPAANANIIKISRVNYDQFLLGSTSNEEFYATVGTAVMVGS